MVETSVARPTPRGRKTVRPRPLALAYVRVSTSEQASEGASLDAQRAALIAEGERRGWEVEVVADEGFSAKSLKRPALTEALARLDAGDADYLLALRLDRVSRSVADFTGLLARSNRRGWGIVLLSPDLDTTTAAGRLMAHVVASVAEYERDLIGERTREGMMQRKAEGVHIGRPRTLPEAVRERIAADRSRGLSLAKIAAALNAEGVPTAQGGVRWYASTVAVVLRAR